MLTSPGCRVGRSGNKTRTRGTLLGPGNFSETNERVPHPLAYLGSAASLGTVPIPRRKSPSMATEPLHCCWRNRRVRENKNEKVVQENDSRSCCEAVPEEECAEIQYVRSVFIHEFIFLFEGRLNLCSCCWVIL